MNPRNAQRTQRLAGFEKSATRVAVGLVIAGPVLGIVAAALGAAEFYPSDYGGTVTLTAALTPVGLALLIGACGGLYIMGGWKVAPFGVVFVAGFAALVYGIADSEALWCDIGVGLLAVSGAVFYAFGVISQRVPPAMLHLWGHFGALVAGAVIAVIGQLIGYWGLLLFGAMAVGCAAGGLVGRPRRGCSGGCPMSTLTTHERTVVSAVPTGLWIGGDVVPGSRGTLDVHDPATGAVLTEVAYAAEFLRWFSEEAVRIYGRWSVASDRNSRLLTMKQSIGVGLDT